MTGRGVFLSFLTFFGGIAAVNAVMVTLAVRTHSGMVTDHPYEKGLAYNQVIAAEEAQQARGWSGELALRPPRVTGGPLTLSFVLKDAHSRVLLPEKVTVTFTRPTRGGIDFTVPLHEGVAEVTFAQKGVWDARVDVVRAGVPFYYAARLTVD